MKLMKFFSWIGGIVLLASLFLAPASACAQENQPQPANNQPLIMYTPFPSRIIGRGESISMPLKLRADVAQTAQLSINNLPAGWGSSFRTGSQLVDAVYLNGKDESSVDLRIEPPKDAEAGKYDLTVTAKSELQSAELMLSFTIQEKVPARLSLDYSGLPYKRGAPDTTFTFTANLQNEGDDDLVVDLSASQLENIQISFQSAGQDVTEMELLANETKNLTIKVDPLIKLDAGKYPFTVQATAGDLKSELQLSIEVVGEGNLSLSAPDGRLSAQAYAGKANPLKLQLTNTGTAPVLGVDLTSSEPSGWSVTFDQPQIAEIPAGQSVEINAQVSPPEKAVAGDYVITINARPQDMEMKSADFRITVRTSTLWGIAGIGLIALAVAVVGIAVTRFGRR